MARRAWSLAIIGWLTAWVGLARAQDGPVVTHGLTVAAVPNPPVGPQVRLSQPYGRKGPISLRSTEGAPDVALSLVGRAPSGPQVVASYDGADTSGNTSVAHDTADIYKWSGASPFAHEDWGYFTADGGEVPYVKRDRDLGQTFTHAGRTPARLRAITVRTAFGSNVVRPGTFGQAVSLQLFRVTGTPRVHDNGTVAPASALHGFPHDRRGQAIPAERDDYYVGERFEPLAVLRGARFPAPQEFGLPDATRPDPGHPALKGRYLRFDVSGTDLVLEPGAVYAFLVLIDHAGDDRGFTLANHYVGHYSGGHGIRRDGNGVFPPAVPNPAKPFRDPANGTAWAAAHFPRDFIARAAIPPGTNGYPDVDTWRDLSFWVEVEEP
jgi:hypothetical protein